MVKNNTLMYVNDTLNIKAYKAIKALQIEATFKHITCKFTKVKSF